MYDSTCLFVSMNTCKDCVTQGLIVLELFLDQPNLYYVTVLCADGFVPQENLHTLEKNIWWLHGLYKCTFSLQCWITLNVFASASVVIMRYIIAPFELSATIASSVLSIDQEQHWFSSLCEWKSYLLSTAHVKWFIVNKWPLTNYPCLMW